MAKKKSIDTVDLKPKQVSNVLRHNIRLKIPTYLWGAPGIGKSDIVRQIATEMGADFIDVRLSQIEPSDIRGMPYPDKDAAGNSVVSWAPPSFFPKDSTRPSIIFLDEMNAAAPTIQAASYQLVLDRRVGEYKLPDNAAVLAAGKP